MRGSFKGSPVAIVRAHRKTYADARTPDVLRRRDFVLFECFPFAVSGALLVLDVRLRPSAAVGLLTVCGLLSAFLFGVLLQISQRAVDLADAEPEPGPALSAHADFLEQLAANAAYASLISILAAIDFAVAATHFRWAWVIRIASAVGIALGFHLVMVLMMVMKRVFALTQERLTRARTGADRPRGQQRNVA